jgi:hypothetical protein
MTMADFMCMVLNITLCLVLLAVGVLLVEAIWNTVRRIIVRNKED